MRSCYSSSALLLEPDYHAMRYDYVLTLLARHKHAQALEELERLLAIDPAQSRLSNHPRDRVRRSGQQRAGDASCTAQMLTETPRAADRICPSRTP